MICMVLVGLGFMIDVVGDFVCVIGVCVVYFGLGVWLCGEVLVFVDG